VRFFPFFSLLSLPTLTPSLPASPGTMGLVVESEKSYQGLLAVGFVAATASLTFPRREFASGPSESCRC
jgi:hypothetical protein